MNYYEKIASLTKKDLIKDAQKNMKILDELKIEYKKGNNFKTIQERLHIHSLDLDKMNRDTLYLLNVQLDILINKT